MTSIVPLSWDFRSFLCGVITHIAFFALVLNKTYRKPFTGLQLSTRENLAIGVSHDNYHSCRTRGTSHSLYKGSEFSRV